MRWLRRPEPWVFAILLGSYAFFWQSRDWNTATRLMLTYAVVDRGTIAINGLQEQSGDRARFRGYYYTDKMPGFSFLATVPYKLAKTVLRLPSHPLNRPGFPYWPADYWTTLGSSGLFTALIGVVLVGLARDLGCGPRQSALVALAYGLGTPAYVYATLSYGHQVASLLLLASFALIWRVEPKYETSRIAFAGFFAAAAAVVELQLGLISAMLGFYLLAQMISGRRRFALLGDFAIGATVPTILLLLYNQLAFGSPFDLAYFHEDAQIFRKVHNAANPLGLRLPALGRLSDLVWGRYRGLLFYAPITLLTLPGWFVLARRRLWGMFVFTVGVGVVMLGVAISYPLWTGGWSTGPRFLLPFLPFAMLPVAALLSIEKRWPTAVAVVLAFAGAVLMLLFVGVGGRIHDQVHDPLIQLVLPHWMGRPLEDWEVSSRFAVNIVSLLLPTQLLRIRTAWQWVQFLPLVLAQAIAVTAMFRLCAPRPLGGKRVRSGRPAPDPARTSRAAATGSAAAGSDPRVNQQQEGRRPDQDTHDPRAEPKGVGPDPRP